MERVETRMGSCAAAAPRASQVPEIVRRALFAIVVAVLVAVVAIPAVAVAQEAWCGGAYDARKGSNFGPCPVNQGAVQVAGQASGIQGQNGRTSEAAPFALGVARIEKTDAFLAQAYDARSARAVVRKAPGYVEGIRSERVGSACHLEEHV